MCGIAGYFCANREQVPDEAALWEMVRLLHHRGPDAQNVYPLPGATLGHTRLSIIDLDPRSNQPLVDPDTGRVITYNGEIYNYLELRQELCAKGYVFRTQSDTEVILKAYDCWGEACLNRFNGMWAFAIFDPATHQLFAARDRFGIKPFVYGQRRNGDLVFASEAKSIFTVFSEFRRPNFPFLTHFIREGEFAGYCETFYLGLYNLLPGHYFVAGPGELPNQVRYWTWQPQVQLPAPPDQEALAYFEDLLQDAIKLRLRSDVPVGFCLSGGVDSASVVGLAKRLNLTRIATFSCIFPDVPDVDESAYIRHSVSHFGVDAHYIQPVFPDFLAAMRRCVWEQDGPTGGPSVLSQRAVMELAQGNVTVLLDGQGADEVLGGYHTFFAASLRTLVRQFKAHPGLGSLRQYLQAALAIERRTGRKQPKLKALWKQVQAPPQFTSKRYGLSVLDDIVPDGTDDLQTRMVEELCLALPNLLHYEDRNSMACSLESRLPFMDYRLVKYAFSLPHQFKIRGSRTKWLLTETVQDVLAQEVLNRPDKMGFNTPGQVWFRQAGEALGHYLTNNNAIWQRLSPEQQVNLTAIWHKTQAGQKVRTFTDEGFLWRYLTSVLFLEQLEQPPAAEWLSCETSRSMAHA